MEEVQRGDHGETISQRDPRLKTDVLRAPAPTMDLDAATDPDAEWSRPLLSDERGRRRSEAQEDATDHCPTSRSYQSNSSGQEFVPMLWPTPGKIVTVKGFMRAATSSSKISALGRAGMVRSSSP